MRNDCVLFKLPSWGYLLQQPQETKTTGMGPGTPTSTEELKHLPETLLKVVGKRME